MMTSQRLYQIFAIILVLSCHHVLAAKWSSVSHSGGPEGRHGMTGVHVSGNYVLFGGVTSSGEYLNDIWDFTFKGRGWTKVPTSSNAVPEPRAFASSYLWGNSWYVGFGEGKPADSDASTPLVFHNDIWKWDDANKAWTQFPAVGPQPPTRSRSAMGVVADKVYAFGGLSNNGTALGDFIIFNTKTGGWTLGKTPQVVDSCDANKLNSCYPAPRYGTANVFLNDWLVMYGGYAPGIGDMDDFWIWDIGQGVVVSPAIEGGGPSRRRGAVAAKDSGDVYIYGGYSEEEGYLNDLYRLQVHEHGTSKWKRYIGRSGHMPLLFSSAIGVFSTGLKTKFYVMYGAKGDYAPTAIGAPIARPNYEHPEDVYQITINQTGFIILVVVCCSVGFIVVVIAGYCFYSRCYRSRKQREQAAFDDPQGGTELQNQVDEQTKQRALALARMNMIKEQRARMDAAHNAIQASDDVAHGLMPGGDGLGTNTVPRTPGLRRL